MGATEASGSRFSVSDAWLLELYRNSFRWSSYSVASSVQLASALSLPVKVINQLVRPAILKLTHDVADLFL